MRETTTLFLENFWVGVSLKNYDSVHVCIS